MHDEHGLLHGEIKRMRVLSFDKLNKTVLTHYLAEAIKLTT